MLFVSLDPNQGEELDKLATLNKLLLRYHSPGCGHCTAMSPEWENVKKDKRLHNANIKIVDANVGITHNSKHPSAQDVSTKGVPTIYLIDGNSMVEYNGERKQEEIVSFALDKSQSGEKKKSFVRRKRTRRVKRKGRKNTRKRPTRKSKAKRRTKK